MQIVIEISKETYEALVINQYCGSKSNLENIIVNGTPLPKHHGRLIDADDLYENTEICHSDIDGYACVRWKDINDAPTIIERSDKE